MVIRDEAAKNNDGHPDQERQYRQPLDGRTTADRIFPILFARSERDLEDGGDKRSDAHKEHFYPKRNRQQFADRLPDDHQPPGREKDAKRTRQPRAETIRRLP